MFRFTGMWYECDDFDKAIKIMMNNVRYWFNGNQTSTSLFAYNNTGTGENLIEEPWAPPFANTGWGDTGTLSVYKDVVNNNSFIEAWYYAGTPLAGQMRSPSVADGAEGWVNIPFMPAGGQYEKPYLFEGQRWQHKSISDNIYTAIKTLFTTGGVTYEDTLLHLNALDNSNERELVSNNAGQNYNIWTPANGAPADVLTPKAGVGPPSDWNILSTSYLTAPGRIDPGQRGISYPFTNKTQENILYNFDYITGSPLLPGVNKSKADFIDKYDVGRPVPNTRYLRINQGDIDITFSYATELIKMQESTFHVDQLPAGHQDLHKLENGKSYLGARITLWTSADQQEG
jgi:hypothetical protein